MYKIPSIDKLTPLREAILLQACFGENEVILNFHNDCRLSVFDKAALESRPRAQGACILDSYFGKSIIGIEAGDTSVVLRFDVGEIEIKVTSSVYETIEFFLDGQSIVV